MAIEIADVYKAIDDHCSMVTIDYLIKQITEPVDRAAIRELWMQKHGLTPRRVIDNLENEI